MIVRRILKHKKVHDATLSLVFVSDRNIHHINKQYLGHDYPTDVITFDYLTDDPVQRRCRQQRRVHFVEGELIISVDTAKKNAIEYGTTPLKEITLYLIHGLLHLLGYDDHTDEDIKRMRAEEKKLMKLFYKKI